MAQTYPPKSPLIPLFQRGEFLPFVKGGKEGFRIGCLPYYGLTNNYPALGIQRKLPDIRRGKPFSKSI